MPDIVYDSIDDVPEGLREGAKVDEATKKATVKVVLSSKLDEFRETNVKVSRERDELATMISKVKPFVGEDPDAFAARLTELQGIEQKVKDGLLKGSDSVATEVDNRVKAMKSDYERQLQEQASAAAKARDEATVWQNRHLEGIVNRAVTDAVVNPNSGALPDALEDILSRARNVFKVVDGKLQAMDGQAVRYGSDGATPMTPLEWLSDLRKKAPYLFKGSSGGGATGGAGGKEFSATFGKTPAEYAALSPEAKLALVHKAKATAKGTAYRPGRAG